MDKYIDLHLHTTASDGTSSPQEVVKKAANLGFSAIAITDHDTISGLEEALMAGDKYDVEVIPGIELNTDYKDFEIHILGYFIDYNSEILLDKLASLKKARYNRIKKMIDKLSEIEIEISFDEVKKVAGDAPLGRAHLAQVILEQGYESDWSNVFDKYIGRQGPAYVERKKINPREAIELIKSIGGVPVVAHPGLINSDRVVKELIDWGIKGLEVYHTEHSQEDVKRYKSIAEEKGLLITSGSDCHGKKRKEGELIGKVKGDYELLEELKKLVAVN